MKIVNYDAPSELAEKLLDLQIPSFVLEVVRSLIREWDYDRLMHECYLLPHHQSLPLSSIRKFKIPRYENIANLLHTIPIYLRDSNPEECREENAIIDLLGAYFPNRANDNPYIELYLSKIATASKGNDLHFKWLFTKVLIHELAHAALDIFNWEHCNQKTEKVQYCTKFGKWREESMANAAALNIIKAFGDKAFYDFSKQFMLSQPAEYALGVLMEDADRSDFKSVVRGKENGVNAKLQDEWLKYVAKSPTPIGMKTWNWILSHNSVDDDLLSEWLSAYYGGTLTVADDKKWNEILCSKFTYDYNNKYYTSENELVDDIVDDVLKEFLSSNGTKMTIDEFKSIFPNIINGKTVYEPSANVQDDWRYKRRIELLDGDLSLYGGYWDNESLHQFVKNTNYKFTEYKNR